MLKHRWNKENECIKCGILRKKLPIKTFMEVVDGRDYYKYETKYKYHIGNGRAVIVRPNCRETKNN